MATDPLARYRLRPAYAEKVRHSVCDQPTSLWNELGLPFGNNETGPSTTCTAGYAAVTRIEETLFVHKRSAASFEKAAPMGGKEQWKSIQEALGTSPAGAAAGAVADAPGNVAKFFNFPNLEAFFGALGSAQTWVRAGEAIGGVILIYIALKGLTGTGIKGL